MMVDGKLPQQAERLAREFGVTAIVASDGVTSFAWGDIHRLVNVRSIRKSLVSALYGIAVSEGRIDLDTTLADIGIDDSEPGLTAAEKRASLRDLLRSRSGVYHEAAYEAQPARAKRPERGRYAPGEHWYYNNWDFNALGVIYEKVTGEDLYGSFATRIAAPIGMAGFLPSSCRPVFEPCSDHPAHTFSISAHDLARFGLLYLNDGAWAGRRVISTTWIRESTTAHSRTDVGRLGYGYCWWVGARDGSLGPGACFALGSGGQGLAVLPAHNLVVAQVVEPGVRRLDTEHFAKVARAVVSGLGRTASQGATVH